MRKDERITRIAVLSRRLRWAIWIVCGLVLLIVAIVLLGVSLGSFATAVVSIEGVQVPIEEVPLGDRLQLLALFTPFIGLVLAALWYCDRLLALYERGVIFSAENAHLIRRSGQVVLALAVADTVLMPLCLMVLARSADPAAEISIEPSLGLFLVGVGIIVVGHVMSLGAEMAEEQELTI